jgi:hypothetical protein
LAAHLSKPVCWVSDAEVAAVKDILLDIEKCVSRAKTLVPIFAALIARAVSTGKGWWGEAEQAFASSFGTRLEV